MPGTRHEPATAPARVTTRRGWRAMRPLEPALEALHRAAGTPVTARLAWWRAAVAADPGTVPLLLALRGHGGTLTAATLVALRDEDGDHRIASVRPHTDDPWDIAAVRAMRHHRGRLGGSGRRTCLGTVTECIINITESESLQVNDYSQNAFERLL